MAISNVTKLGQIQTAAGLIENSPWNCQIARIWPFMGIDGYALSYASRPVITVDTPSADDYENPSAMLADSAVELVEHTDSPNTPDLPASTPVATSRVFYMAELATRYAVPYSQQDRYTVPNDLIQTEKILAEKRLMYRFFSKIGVTGASVDDGSDFLGLPGIVDTARSFNVGGALTVESLDRGYYAVTDGPGRPNAIMSNSRALRTALSMIAATNLAWAMEMVEVQFDDPLSGPSRVRVPSWRGTPWFVNDLIPVPVATNLTPIFFMLLGDSETPGAGRGITGIVPRSRVGNMFLHRQATAVAQAAPTAPVATFNYGVPIVNMDCTWPVGLAMGSGGALSMVHNFTLIT